MRGKFTMNSSRRAFLAQLGGASAVVALGARAPSFLSVAAAAEVTSRKDAILVVVQLTGGNDGLNTIVPYRDEEYRKARPKLAIPADDVIRINDQLGFHPAARGLADLLEEGKLAIVQGVGYPEPNRSHFESMDVWHTCRRKGGPRTTGWLGRYLDEAGQSVGSDAPALHVGSEKQPMALAADKVRVPSFASPEAFRLEGGDDQPLVDLIGEMRHGGAPAANPLLGYLESSTTSAFAASKRIAEALGDDESPVEYPESELAARLKTVAQLIDAGLSTRIFYVELDGFDTHSQQAAAHAALLKQYGGALRSFIEDVAHRGHGDRVLTASFSEFGRRVAENASEGTDHGAAAPVFLCGAGVRAGLTGAHPSLTDLDDGDLKFHTDFRQVYAALLEGWLGGASSSILGGRFEPADFLSA
jgi:uncharacterized protein (DUF1501 family)